MDRHELNPARWEEVQATFLKLADLPPEESEFALLAISRRDPELAEDVRRMLATDREAVRAFDRRALESVAANVAAERQAAEAMDAAPPLEFDGYRLVRLVGSGSSGAVYEAQERWPRRRVAIKLLRSGRTSEVARQRFMREAEILAKFSDDRIMRVLRAGVLPMPDGRPYIVLEYVEGKRLLESPAASASIRERLRLMADVCEAVQKAHAHGVIHRDLKPANIIVTPEGRPKVLDFGIARLIGETGQHAAATLHGEVLGTAAYMSPEQAGGIGADGRLEEVDTQTDVYALGAIAYHLLSGRAPIDASGRSLMELLACVQRGEIGPLSSVAPSTRGDIEAVVMRALAREKRRRYQSAQELAREFWHAAAGEPVSARPPSTARQVWRLARKRPLTTVAAVVAMMVGVAGVFELNRTRRRAEEDFETASRMADVLLHQVLKDLRPLAGTLQTRRDSVQALKPYVERLARARPEDERFRFNLARVRDAEAEIAAYDLDWTGSIALREEARRILDALCASEGAETDWHELRSLVLVKTGDAYKALGDVPAAVARYEEALLVDEAIAAVAPGNVKLQDHLYWSYQRLADNLGPIDAVRAEYYRGLKRRQSARLYEMSPDRPGSIYVKLTTLAEDAVWSDWERLGAQEVHEQFAERLSLGRRLLKLSPDNRGHVLRVAADLTGCAAAYERCGDLSEARQRLFAGRGLIGPLYQSDPDDVAVVEAKAHSLIVGAAIAESAGDVAWAVQQMTEAVLTRRLAAHAAGTPSIERTPALCETLLNLLQLMSRQKQGAEISAVMDELVFTARGFWIANESPLFVKHFAGACTWPEFQSLGGATLAMRIAEDIESIRSGSAVPALLRAEVLAAQGDVEGAHTMWASVAERGDECGRFAATRMKE